MQEAGRRGLHNLSLPAHEEQYFFVLFLTSQCHFKTTTAFAFPVLYEISFNNIRQIQTDHEQTR